MKQLPDIIIFNLLILIIKYIYKQEKLILNQNNNEVLKYSLVCKKWSCIVSKILLSNLNFKNINQLKPLIENIGENKNNSKLIKNYNNNNLKIIFNSKNEFLKHINQINNYKKVLVKINNQFDSISILKDQSYGNIHRNCYFNLTLSIKQNSDFQREEGFNFSKITNINEIYIEDLDEFEYQKGIEKILFIKPKIIIFSPEISLVDLDISNIFQDESIKCLTIPEFMFPKYLSNIDNHLSNLKSLKILTPIHDIINSISINKCEINKNSNYQNKGSLNEDFYENDGNVNTQINSKYFKSKEDINSIENDIESMSQILAYNTKIKELSILGSCNKDCYCNKEYSSLDLNFPITIFKRIFTSQFNSIETLELDSQSFFSQELYTILAQNKTIKNLTLIENSFSQLIVKTLVYNKTICNLKLVNSDENNLIGILILPFFKVNLYSLTILSKNSKNLDKTLKYIKNYLDSSIYIDNYYNKYLYQIYEFNIKNQDNQNSIHIMENINNVIVNYDKQIKKYILPNQDVSVFIDFNLLFKDYNFQEFDHSNSDKDEYQDYEITLKKRKFN